jgi:hypothetical protein
MGVAEKARRAIPENHPAWQAALNAPVEPETEGERQAIAAALRSGKLTSGAYGGGLVTTTPGTPTTR